LVLLAVRDVEEGLMVVGADSAGQLHGQRYIWEEDFMTGEIVLEEEFLDMPQMAGLQQLRISPDMRHVFALDQQGLLHIMSDTGEGYVSSQQIGGEREAIAGFEMLLGGLSLMTFTASGEVSQWFFVRDEYGVSLQKIRNFDGPQGALAGLLPEQRRKGFVAVGKQGSASIFHSTARRLLVTEAVAQGPITQSALAPRASLLLVENLAGELAVSRIHNEHPEISWQALWGKVWYESYPKPEYVWQSSASNNDFEPKYSLAPLAFGTLKAAFYAMLLAAPLAICGAIYTAYFMAPALRRKVKPLVELIFLQKD
jgi:phosphate transport system permease protein